MNTTNQNTPQGGYGFSEHVAKESSISFGLNSGATLTEFEWTANGGKDNAPLEALNIEFTINGTTKGYRKFPVTRAYAKQDDGTQVEVTDPSHPAVIAEQKMLSATLIHIIGCFVEKSEIQEALSSRPIAGFKDFCNILKSLLPADYTQKPLDIFAHYQWQITGENKVTYLEFPKNMKQGRWITASIKPVGAWEKQQKANASTGEVALRYVDADGNVHPFSRSGWFMESNFAKQQKEEASAGGAAMQSSTNSGGTSGDW